MKKIISYLAALAVMTSFTACGAKSENTVPAAETTTAATTTAAATTAAETTASAKPADTAAPVTSSETTAAAKEEITLDLADYLFGGYVALDSGSLKLYSKPDNSSDVLAEIPYSTQIEIYSSGTDGWYKTGFDGKTGFVDAAFISEIEAYEDNASEGPAAADREEVAVSKIKDLNVILLLTNVMDETDSKDGFVKVEDERFRSPDDLINFIKDTCSGEAREKFLHIMDHYQNCYMEKDGELYFKPAGRGVYQFVTDGGVTVTDPAMDHFTATTNEDDEMNPFMRAVFHSEDGNWTIESYEYSYDGYSADVTANDSIGPEDFLGTWSCGRMWASIREEDYGYNVHIQWSWSAADGIEYEYNCYYDDSTSTLRCDGGGTAVYYCYDEDEAVGEDPSEYEFDDGTAVFALSGNAIYWTDGTVPGSEPQMLAR